MADPRPEQLASMLTKAANLRPELKRVRVYVAPDDHTLLIIQVHRYEGTGRTMEVRSRKLLDGRTIGQIMDAWFGELPNDPHNGFRQRRLSDEQARVWQSTPWQYLELVRRKRMQPAPIPPSRLAEPFRNREGDDKPSGVQPAIPPPRVQMTRDAMLQAGMDRKQRAERYRQQGGKHPDDLEKGQPPTP